jgi:nicotinamide mononucleotide transporter
MINLLDPIGAGLSLVCTYYFAKASRSAWVIGMVAIFVNVILYWQKGIYGALFLEGIYFLSMIYGWWQWSCYSNTQTQKPIRALTLREGCQLIPIAFIGILLSSFILRTWTDSDIPYLDAITTTLSLLAQWLLCLKIIHCWFLWFFVDALTAIMQLYKGIPFHSAIYWMYLIFAVMGYIRWRRLRLMQLFS